MSENLIWRSKTERARGFEELRTSARQSLHVHRMWRREHDERAIRERVRLTPPLGKCAAGVFEQLTGAGMPEDDAATVAAETAASVALRHQAGAPEQADAVLAASAALADQVARGADQATAVADFREAIVGWRGDESAAPLARPVLVTFDDGTVIPDGVEVVPGIRETGARHRLAAPAVEVGIDAYLTARNEGLEYDDAMDRVPSGPGVRDAVAWFADNTELHGDDIDTARANAVAEVVAEAAIGQFQSLRGTGMDTDQAVATAAGGDPVALHAIGGFIARVRDGFDENIADPDAWSAATAAVRHGENYRGSTPKGLPLDGFDEARQHAHAALDAHTSGDQAPGHDELGGLGADAVRRYEWLTRHGMDHADAAWRATTDAAAHHAQTRVNEGFAAIDAAEAVVHGAVAALDFTRDTTFDADDEDVSDEPVPVMNEAEQLTLDHNHEVAGSAIDLFDKVRRYGRDENDARADVLDNVAEQDRPVAEAALNLYRDYLAHGHDQHIAADSAVEIAADPTTTSAAKATAAADGYAAHDVLDGTGETTEQLRQREIADATMRSYLTWQQEGVPPQEIAHRLERVSPIGAKAVSDYEQLLTIGYDPDEARAIAADTAAQDPIPTNGIVAAERFTADPEVVVIDPDELMPAGEALRNYEVAEDAVGRFAQLRAEGWDDDAAHGRAVEASDDDPRLANAAVLAYRGHLAAGHDHEAARSTAVSDTAAEFTSRISAEQAGQVRAALARPADAAEFAAVHDTGEESTVDTNNPGISAQAAAAATRRRNDEELYQSQVEQRYQALISDGVDMVTALRRAEDEVRELWQVEPWSEVMPRGTRDAADATAETVSESTTVTTFSPGNVVRSGTTGDLATVTGDAVMGDLVPEREPESASWIARNLPARDSLPRMDLRAAIEMVTEHSRVEDDSPTLTARDAAAAARELTTEDIYGGVDDHATRAAYLTVLNAVDADIDHVIGEVEDTDVVLDRVDQVLATEGADRLRTPAASVERNPGEPANRAVPAEHHATRTPGELRDEDATAFWAGVRERYEALIADGVDENAAADRAWHDTCARRGIDPASTVSTAQPDESGVDPAIGEPDVDDTGIAYEFPESSVPERDPESRGWIARNLMYQEQSASLPQPDHRAAAEDTATDGQVTEPSTPDTTSGTTGTRDAGPVTRDEITDRFAALRADGVDPASAARQAAAGSGAADQVVARFERMLGTGAPPDLAFGAAVKAEVRDPILAEAAVTRGRVIEAEVAAETEAAAAAPGNKADAVADALGAYASWVDSGADRRQALQSTGFNGNQDMLATAAKLFEHYREQGESTSDARAHATAEAIERHTAKPPAKRRAADDTEDADATEDVESDEDAEPPLADRVAECERAVEDVEDAARRGESTEDVDEDTERAERCARWNAEDQTDEDAAGAGDEWGQG
ncbi:hypothetical protein CFP71_29875 [Amycolatopsis thailandensis]|uniref:Uncharacterized protein n=1 Tax=Amycolatopsis thailandensis TaxID=589330 RepID=A0A229RSC6_9PSEU|nr:hypothetical protein [Amycolatopsis thailandensis]OXM49556.1 hypothetical protein CFP71_29875 [Amycolatopsis thailandensis]